MKDLKGKKVLVLGAARSGRAAAGFLLKKGAEVTVYDREAESFRGGFPGEAVMLSGTAPEDVQTEGFDMAVASPGFPPSNPLFGKLAALDIPVISELELGLRFLGKGVRIAAVTGTNGKTTTALMLGHLTGGTVAGNIGKPLTRMIDEVPDTGILVLEVSSFQIPLSPSLSPDAGILLNLFPEHTEWHGSFKEYWKAKRKMFERMSPGSTGIFNADMEKVGDFVSGLECGKVFFSSERRVPGGVYADGNDIVVDISGRERRFKRPDPRNIPGTHNTENLMGALAACAALGVEEIPGMDGFRLPPHRLERFREGSLEFINDSKATNPESVRRALESVDAPFILLMGGKSKKVSLGKVPELASGRAYAVILFGESRGELEQFFPENLRVFKAPGLREAVRLAVETAPRGCSILLSPGGASFDEFEDYTHRGEKFREWAKEFTGKKEEKAV